jgi:(1->4)-alpha-D-glucan 1-alpha-D-glucosylmutase
MRAPSSCYRLQLSADFTLADARRTAPYLHALGVGDVYASPLLAARPGSGHGYDVVDPTRVSPELGGEEALASLHETLAGLGMGLLADVVPNHMAADHRNPWWWDVLRHGRASAHAHLFDIDWDAPGAGGKLVIPVLGAPLEDTIARGELWLADAPDGPCLAYYDRRFPLAPGTGPAAAAGLGELVAAQHYRPVHWRRAGEVNYRRFFDVADLVSLTAERDDTFRATHGRLLELVARGAVTGLRIDHVDGLLDPRGYLDRLRGATGGAYVVVEKILARDEALPAGWAAAGTTGYDFLALVGGLFVDPAGAARLHDVHRRRTGLPATFERVAEDGRRRALDELFGSDLERAARRAERAGLAAGDPGALRRALVALTVHLDVYRTYVRAAPAAPADAARVRRAAERAHAELDAEARERLAAVVAAIAAPDPATLPFVSAWQQLTGPVAAKGVEDTALYADTALLARNEPGCGGDWPSTDPAEFHRRLAERAGASLSCTSTHDTKRSEDVRMRLAALSELADDWERAFSRWRELNKPLRRRPDTAPDANEEWLLYQTLLGVWPAAGGTGPDLEERIARYMTKAAREAKRNTGWLAPDPGYEADLTAFATAALDPGNRPFVPELEELARRCAAIGARNSLALLTLKLAAPGVPDVYWGNELWDLSLVDPDNRRPVDFEARAGMLRAIEERAAADPPGLASQLWAGWEDGLVKLHVTRCGLRLRRRLPELFAEGAYLPVAAAGEHAGRVVALARAGRGGWVAAAVPRLAAGIAGWGDTVLHLPAGAPTRWRNVFTEERLEGREVPLATLLGRLPVALLHAPA